MITHDLRVMFLCRGSMTEGMGHVMRSRSVAASLHDKANVKVIVVGDESVADLLCGHDLDYIITGSEQHALHHFRHFAPHVVVFDLTHLDADIMRDISQECRTVSLSPIFNGLDDVDLVFHRTSVPGKNWGEGEGKPVLKCGLDYAIVPAHCHRISDESYRENLAHQTPAVAISMGGSDAANRTLAVLDRMKDVSDRLLLWVMLGQGYTHSYEKLVHCVRGSRHEIIFAKTNDSMWRILKTCALAILAGGTTTYEAAYAGLPSVNTLETPEHYFLIRELVDKGVCLYGGYTFEESLSALRGIVTRLNRNREELWLMHQRGEGLIDGDGVHRIARDILELPGGTGA